jgi:predicted kinase
MKTLYMLVGVPGSGKSFWVNNQNIENSVVISTDNHIERFAILNNTIYSEIFNKVIGEATRLMNEDLRKAINEQKNLLWDQTNLNVKSRRGKLTRVPKTYHKVAVVFATPDPVTHRQRLENRAGKTIPDHVLQSMIDSLEVPTIEEGFNEVIFA